jgi:kynurenine formamidase
MTSRSTTPGTYADAPFHRYPDGADLGALPLTALAALPGIVVPATADTGRGLEAAAFQELEVGGRAVLLHTGWDAYWGTAGYGDDNPFLTEAAARHLADSGAALVGIDSPNIDDRADLRRPAHSILLAAGIPIIEHLRNLGAIADRPFAFFAVATRLGAALDVEAARDGLGSGASHRLPWPSSLDGHVMGPIAGHPDGRLAHVAFYPALDGADQLAGVVAVWRPGEPRVALRQVPLPASERHDGFRFAVW